jgi:hypothetical protein
METCTVCANAAKIRWRQRGKWLVENRENEGSAGDAALEDSDHSCDEHCSFLAALFARALK